MRQSGKLAPFESYAGHVPGVFGRLVTSPWLLLGLYLAANLVALILTGVVELFALMLTLPGLVVATLVLAVLVARLFMRGAAYPGSMVLVNNSMEADCSRDVAKEVFSAAVHAEAALAEAGVATSCRAAAASLARAGFGAAAPPTSVSSGRCPAGAAAATLRHVQTVLSAQLAMSDAVRDTDVGRRSAVGAPAEAVAGETSTPFARRMLHELALAIAGLTAISSESRRLAALAASVEWTEALTSPLAPEAAEAGIAAVCPRPRPTAAIVAVTEEPEPGEAAAAAAAANERVLAAGSLTPHARLRFLELRAGQGALERATVAAINQLLTGSSATPGVGGGSSAGAASAAAPTVFDVIAATSSRLRSLQRASVWMSKAGGGAGGGGAGAWGNVAVVDLDPTEGVGAGGRRPPVQGTHMAELPDPSSEAAGAGGAAAPAPGLGSDMDTWEDAEDEAAAEELLSSMEAERSVQESRRRIALAQGLLGGGAGDSSSPAGGSSGRVRWGGADEGPSPPGSTQRGSGAEGAGSERPRTADNEPEEGGGGGGGGIISTITALPSMSVRLATQLANAWARRNAPGPVGGFGFQRVEMLLAHDGWTVTLDQEDGAFVDAAVLPFRRSTPCPDPGRWVGRGARQAAEREGALAADHAATAGGLGEAAAAAAASHVDEAPAEPLSALGLLPAAWGAMLPGIGGASHATGSPSHSRSGGSASSCPGPSRAHAAPSTPPRSASFGSANRLSGAATGLGRPLMGSQKRSSRRRPAAAAVASGAGGGGARADGLASSSSSAASAHSRAHLHRQDVGDRPVVICSNPNGGLYELWHRWSESLELYLSNGFTVIVYNYRGYGRSTGAPSPGRCTADAEALVRYARRHLGARHVLAHSESIGGIVSSRLAASGAVDGLIGDRNFDNLALTASMLMGRWAEVGMHALSRWAARSNAEAILEATCPKIILANPAGDEVIGLPASASVGVANRVADAWAEVAGPLPSPPSSPLPIDPAASSCPPGCIKACPGKRSALSPNDSLASVARRFQLALARATMACAHNLAPAEALQACAVAQDVRFPGASIRRRAASEARPEAEQSSLLVALEPEELSVRRLAVAAEDETRAGPAARPGASSARSGARPGSTASVPPLASAETDVQSLSPANASLPLFLSPRVPPTFVDADLIAACIPSLQQAPPIARDRIFSPGATTAVRGKVAEALAAAEKDASASAAGAGRAAAGLELDLELLRETAFPGISVAAEAMLRAFRGDVPAAIVAALCSGQTAAGPTLTVLQGDLLSHPAAAPGFFALHTVYSMAWAVESGADAVDTTASGQVPLWARPASQAARLACGLPLRPDSAWAGGARAGPGALLAAPADPGALFPDGPSLSTAGPIPSTSLVGVMALPTRLDQLPGGGALAPGAQHASLHASVALASVISERLHPTAVERGDPGAKEAMQALSAARRIVEIAEWIALRGGPRAQLDAALARGTLPRDGPATGWRMLASRALRPEGVLITLEGRGHNMAWRRNHVAMIRDCGQRLGWWPTGKFVDDAAPDAAPPSPAETTAGADSPIDAHEVMLEA
ncbi:hypothetical protein FNF27_02968 [Cafeteria roenbergensis]|uniref:AB hydrolase-1 domain-containing protein n=1 Tax=Cafeteria roenbergensis TaxID=33653 RepID=A0A5A8EE73_CAFRO|nr:hypothetical protein FNF27_02968 [Cafeteria roenbergensis]